MITWKDPTPAFHLKIERRFWPPSSLLFLVGGDPLERPRILYLRCRGFSAFAVPSVLHPTTSRILASSITGSGGSGGALNGAVPSSSVSSDSQDSVSVNHGFLSLGTDLRARSVRVSLRNISSSSRDTPSRAPLLFQHHGSILDFVHKFSFNHSDMPELSLHSCVQEKSVQ